MLSIRWGSTSSSELANASESGVERRALSLSRRIAWLVGAMEEKLPWPALFGWPTLIVPELIVNNQLKGLFGGLGRFGLGLGVAATSLGLTIQKPNPGGGDDWRVRYRDSTIQIPSKVNS